MATRFDSVLIANRGEIACRVIRTCRRMGIRSIAVYSDADAQSLHVRMADTAVRIGGAAARESYLDRERILAAARQTGAAAIHPGYGFLSENAEFAEACLTAGVVFIGPPAAAIRAMGSKAAAKALMRAAGVPLTPGYDGAEQSEAFLTQQADAIGYPVMIKASAGGGGKGMRRVDEHAQFAAALAACKREAAAAFGDDAVLLEKYLMEPRHVEVQVFGDTHGNVVSLFERDCSVQRRHQKVIEEAPAPRISDETRRRLSEAACSAARAVNYVSAGTVEFLLDRQGRVQFMEMNTRLQVEHPVTEMITGLDLVEWQIRIAAGEVLPLRQDEISMRGHAIEARIYAENPAKEFLPSIGKLVHLRGPAESEHVRVDAGVEQGDLITPYYDPMIAKLIVWERDRESAVRRMAQALAEFQVVGVANNVRFLKRLVTSPSFVSVRLDTDLIAREREWIATEESGDGGQDLAMAALAQLLREKGQNAPVVSPWARQDGWRNNGTLVRQLNFSREGSDWPAQVEYGAHEYSVSMGDRTIRVAGAAVGEGDVDALIDGRRVRFTAVWKGDELHLFVEGRHEVFCYEDPLDVEARQHGREGSLLAPMPGRIIAHLVAPGDRVEKGAPLLVLEAMKMENTVHAPTAGSVEQFHFGVGEQVNEGAELLRFDRDDA